MYNEFMPQITKMLGTLNLYFDKMLKHAETKKYDPSLILQCRLIVDQYPLVKQIQVVCDNAKGTAARLAGKEPPKYDDNETTIPELKARVEKTLSYLKTFKQSDFDGAAERKVGIFFMPGKWMPGFEYLHEFAMPNFYFHLTTAYAILRHNGIDLGKQDFLGNLNFHG